MAYRFNCSKCGRTFRDESEEGLVVKILEHDERTHDEIRGRDEIREGVFEG